jgi:hypothetical protein
VRRAMARVSGWWARRAVTANSSAVLSTGGRGARVGSLSVVRTVALAGARSFAWAEPREGGLTGGDDFRPDAATAVRAPTGTGDGLESPTSLPEPRAHPDPATASTTSSVARER